MIMNHIRACARGIVRNGDKILVSFEAWPTKDDRFYLPLGGSIKYGEHGKDAIIREFKEEIDADIENVRYLGMIENMFDSILGFGHEIVLLYEADLVDKNLYNREKIMGLEDDIEEPSLYGCDPVVLSFYWKSLQEMKEEGLSLYPEGVNRFL